MRRVEITHPSLSRNGCVNLVRVFCKLSVYIDRHFIAYDCTGCVPIPKSERLSVPVTLKPLIVFFV